MTGRTPEPARPGTVGPGTVRIGTVGPGPVRTGTVRIGISGWTYAPWRGVFYPRNLPQKRELAYAARQFATIEINGTFYGMQRPDAFAAWAAAAPDGFVFAVKAPRFITHMKQLRDIETPFANFIASGLLRLGPSLGPVLWQFPPRMRFTRERFEPFLAMLPHDTGAAARLAAAHDHRLKAPAFLDVDQPTRLRHAVEIRHDSFRDQAFIDLLRSYNVALVCADTVAWRCSWISRPISPIAGSTAHRNCM